MDATTRAEETSRAFVRLANTLVGEFDVLDLLHVLVNESVALLDAAAAGLMLADQDGQLHVLASTSEAGQVLEVLQQTTGEGPCVECFRTGTTIAIADVQGMGNQWPRFRSLALAQGFRSVHAIPLRVPSGTIGTLNLFRSRIGTLGAEDAAIGQALADVSTISIMQQRMISETEVVNTQLQYALDSRVLIEQAKGMVAQLQGIDTNEAFQRLRQLARSSNTKLHDVAEAVLNRTITP